MDKIKFKRSTKAGFVPSTAQVDEGELVINLPDKKIFTKDDKGQVINIGGSNGSDAKKLTTEQLNNVLDTGMYVQPVDSNALTTQRQYPLAAGGLLIVENPNDSSIIKQTYTDRHYNQLYIRIKTIDGKWSNWDKFYSQRNKPSASEIGAMPLNNDIGLESDATSILLKNKKVTSTGIKSLHIGNNGSLFAKNKDGKFINIYTSSFKPKPSDIGALSLKGGSVTGSVNISGTLSIGTTGQFSSNNSETYIINKKVPDSGYRSLSLNTNGTVSLYSKSNGYSRVRHEKDNIHPWQYAQVYAWATKSPNKAEALKWKFLDKDTIIVKGIVRCNPINVHGKILFRFPDSIKNRLISAQHAPAVQANNNYLFSEVSSSSGEMFVYGGGGSTSWVMINHVLCLDQK